MKTKFFKDALIVGLWAALITAFVVVAPTPNLQAEQPATTPGMTYERQPPVAAPAVVDDSALPVVDSVDETVAETVQVPTVPLVSLDWLLNQQAAIFAALVILFTFFSKWVPFLSNITDTGKRALAVGVTLIAAFLVWRYTQDGFSWAAFFQLGITYVLTALGYDKVLKPAGLVTPKPAQPAA